MALPSPDLRGRRVLVTGANGLIGRSVVAELLAADADVTALSVTDDPDSPAHRVIVGDATDADVVADALDGVTAIVHLAAVPHRDAGPAREVYRVNVVSLFTVLSLAGERGISRVVAASSINAYGLIQSLQRGLRPPSFPLDADTPSVLGDWYSLSKKSGEDAAAMAWRAWGVDTISLRFPFTAAAADIATHADAQRRDPAADLLEGWSYLDVRDAARAVLAGLRSPVTGAPWYFLAAPRTLVPFRTEDLLRRYAPEVPRRRRFVGREVPIDVEPIRRDLGFTAIHELDLPTLDLPD